MNPGWMATLGRPARVVVIDTGFSPVLAPMTFPQEVRGFTQGADPQHGSYVSRIIASQDPRQLGVAPACELYVAAAVDSRRRWEPMREALRWAVELKADVVNLSLAFAQEDDEVFELCDRLDAGGAIVVASWNQTLAWPHSRPSVVSVSGDRVQAGADAAAPASCQPAILNDRGQPFRGSSVSAAFVAGVAACAKGAEPQLSRQGFLAALGGHAGTPRTAA